MNDKEIQEVLKRLLGENAYNNSGKVEENFSNLVVCVDYLTLQMSITKRWCDDEGKAHIDKVIQTTKKMLTNEQQ